MFCLKALIDIYLSKKKKLYCCYIDYSKAFDSVARTELWHKMLNCNMSRKLLRVIFQMYQSAKSCVASDGVLSDNLLLYDRGTAGRKFISFTIFYIFKRLKYISWTCFRWFKFYLKYFNRYRRSTIISFKITCSFIRRRYCATCWNTERPAEMYQFDGRLLS